MTFLLEKGGYFYFNRRVPTIHKKCDGRDFIRFTLKTDSRKEAVKLAFHYNEKLEAYWKSLAEKEFNKSEALLAPSSTAEKVARRLVVQTHLKTSPSVINYPLGALPQEEHPKTSVLLSEAVDLFWGFAKDKIYNKTENQIRKWKNPRKKAVLNFIGCIGDKPISDVTRSDILKFRDWWLQRIEKENLVPNSANKNFIQLKTVLETVSDNLNLQLDIKHLFNRLLLVEQEDSDKKPFSRDFIVTMLMNEVNLSGLNEQAKNILYAMAETGAGLTELVSLSPEDIVLNTEIPHIVIKPRQKNGLKTKYRKRIIPLVGYALDAFKCCPKGFTNYYDRPDSLSSMLNKYLRDHKLLPSKNHTVYSLRHSFQDRLLAANAPDRVQADLMGHKFNRPSYGDGASLEQKLDWLTKIKLKS